MPTTKTAYLTIDDGPSADFLNKLNFLDSHGICAIWFCQGNAMEQRPEMVIEAIHRGHIIGNHAYSHPHFSELRLDQCYAEIRATDAIIEELYQRSGVTRQHRFFRFPYGDKGDHERDPLSALSPDEKTRRESIQAYLRKLGYGQPIFPDITYRFYRNSVLSSEVDWYWTYDTFDWAPITNAPNPPYGISTIEKLLERMDEDVPEGWRGLNYNASADIILTHDFDMRPDIFIIEIERLIEKGIQFRLP